MHLCIDGGGNTGGWGRPRGAGEEMTQSGRMIGRAWMSCARLSASYVPYVTTLAMSDGIPFV
jgi:hypothetical protein